MRTCVSMHIFPTTLGCVPIYQSAVGGMVPLLWAPGTSDRTPRLQYTSLGSDKRRTAFACKRVRECGGFKKLRKFHAESPCEPIYWVRQPA